MTNGFRLGDWLVQPDQCRISTADRTVQLRAKVMDLLTYLAIATDDAPWSMQRLRLLAAPARESGSAVRWHARSNRRDSL